MKKLFGSLWTRMLAAQLLVLVIGAVALVTVTELVAPSFFAGDIQQMNEMMADPDMADMMGGMMGDSTSGFLTTSLDAGLQDAFENSMRRGLAVSLAVAAVAALAVSGYATWRILAPIQSIRDTTRRLAEGAYDQRVDPPNEVELAALAQDVNALAEALDTTEQRRVRLISEVAHELRTPLATIEGYLEGLLDGVFEPSDEIFVASDREVRRLKRLAEDLSEVSRAEEGALPLVVNDLDLGDLVDTVADHLAVQFRAKEVQLVIVPSDTVTVSADADRLLQVLTNVIGNALAYTEPGGSVSVAVSAERADAIVEVADTGRGLMPEEATAVFERFYRADHSGPGGSGIGLTIARAIARRHAGDITARSPGPGRGSTFTLRLPHA